MRHSPFYRVGWVIALAILIVWWFFLADLISKPRSYAAGVTYCCAVVVSSFWHYRALWRFNRMVKVLKREERAGIAPTGSVIFAANQRFRYLMRSIESFLVMTIGIVAIISVAHPHIQLNRNYIRLVLTYFIGSVLLTGYLTIRDLWVLDYVKKLNLDNNDTATLNPVHAHKHLHGKDDEGGS